MNPDQTQHLELRAKAMVGRRYLCQQDGCAHKIESYLVKDQQFVLYTSKRLFAVDLVDASGLLNQFVVPPPGGTGPCAPIPGPLKGITDRRKEAPIRTVYVPGHYTPTHMKALVDTPDTGNLDWGVAHRGKMKSIPSKSMKKSNQDPDAVVAEALAPPLKMNLGESDRPKTTQAQAARTPRATSRKEKAPAKPRKTKQTTRTPRKLKAAAAPEPTPPSPEAERREPALPPMAIVLPEVPTTPALPTEEASVPAVQTLSVVPELKEILMENIRMVKQDKAYIGQANAINDSVKTLIDLAKTEILAITACQRLQLK
ncbi:hypothetical protein [Telluribacter humicola]|uniref:hypothetical protein n=1 Tax=Telluribacter humicola TaxID=1720261 RepID=UPI001A972E39|nr:hypothetical protein [Telluribacter humicola]